MTRPAIRRAVCPGSFDPVTNGHVDVIARATQLYDEVVVAVLHNPAKAGRFSLDQRLEFLRASLGDLGGAAGRVDVRAFTGRLLVDVCRDVGATVVVKGLRGAADFGFELPMALMNRHLSGVETVFVPGDPRFEHVSSSLVMEVHRYGGDVTGLVPDAVLAALHA